MKGENEIESFISKIFYALKTIIGSFKFTVIKKEGTEDFFGNPCIR